MYSELQKIGKEITQVVKPKAVVVFSAHWQGDDDEVKVNTAEITDLIYEYVHFGRHSTTPLIITVFMASHRTTTRRNSPMSVVKR